jgi:hypothetical protein
MRPPRAVGGMGLIVSLLKNIPGTTHVAMAAYTWVRTQAAVFLTVSVIAFSRRGGAEEDVYNILWAVVFGFATLNILSLAAKQFDPGKRGLSLGELLAVMVVLISIFLLGWEMLSVFHIFPIKLKS